MRLKAATILAALAAVAATVWMVVEVLPGEGAVAGSVARGSDPTPISPPPFPLTREGEDPDAAHVEEAGEPAAGFPAPESFRPSSARRTVAEFMEAWRDRHFKRMALWTTPGWRERVGDDAPRLLRRACGDRRPRGWFLRDSHPGYAGRGTARIEVGLAYRTQLVPRLRHDDVTFLLERQTADGALDAERGRWGIKPVPAPTVSLAR